MAGSATTNPVIIQFHGEMDEQSFTWEVANFRDVLLRDFRINFQNKDFSAGEKIGASSTWSVFLRVQKNNGVKSIGVLYKLKDAQSLCGREHIFSQISVAMKNNEGETIKSADGSLQNIASDMAGWGIKSFIFIDEQARQLERLELLITFKLYVSTKDATCQFSITPTFEVFQAQLVAKARQDLGKLVQEPITGDVKIISGDGKEFQVPWGILTVRSPVFAAMLRADMTEANVGLIEILDISGKALEVLIHHFFTGELLPDWKESGVLVELTNAAAKYELADLLQFLDKMLGRVCDLENVAPLVVLATRLELNIAKDELLKFIREKGAASAENFMQIMKVTSNMNNPNNA